MIVYIETIILHTRMIVSVQYCTVLYSTVQYCTVLDLGPYFGMNGHFRRDPDVISRPSKSIIKDLSFYIGFTRIGPWTLDLGPCFGMNGHFRTDSDVILRLPESIIDVLSFYIGFTSKSNVKMIVLDENIAFVYRKIEIV